MWSNLCYVLFSERIVKGLIVMVVKCVKVGMIVGVFVIVVIIVVFVFGVIE